MSRETPNISSQQLKKNGKTLKMANLLKNYVQILQSFTTQFSTDFCKFCCDFIDQLLFDGLRLAYRFSIAAFSGWREKSFLISAIDHKPSKTAGLIFHHKVT